MSFIDEMREINKKNADDEAAFKEFCRKPIPKEIEEMCAEALCNEIKNRLRNAVKAKNFQKAKGLFGSYFYEGSYRGKIRCFKYSERNWFFNNVSGFFPRNDYVRCDEYTLYCFNKEHVDSVFSLAGGMLDEEEGISVSWEIHDEDSGPYYVLSAKLKCDAKGKVL